MLTPQQIAFFETFGFLVLPGLMAEEIGWITEGFEELFQGRTDPHDGTRRTLALMDHSERLCTLLDHPKIVGIASSLLGEDFNCLAGDANYYVGDTGWHSDGWHDVGLYVKIAFYLDPVTRDTGCLRVIPGSHRLDSPWVHDVRKVARPEENFGVAGRDVPSVALESRPGDVVAFNHNLHHAAFGGNNRRRMFTMNLCQRATTPEEIADLRGFINSQARFWMEHTHSDVMRRTASPERMRHLEQVMANEDELAELSRRARTTMAEPARG
ncbi:MAG: phytanoyl-CoA dioxygenase family protein [Armatimonadetes bacterium]|nr:phytanoyl-CoA dioxygenase family protein [Armatimonadota bacterium]